MDDMDDLINDLLADDTPRKAPPAKSGRGRPGPGGGRGPSGRGRSSSPVPADTMSDVSDADPNQMAKGLDDMDDMDANLFGTKKSGGSSGYTPSAVSAAKPSSPIRTPDTVIKTQVPKIQQNRDHTLTPNSRPLGALHNGPRKLVTALPNVYKNVGLTGSPIRTSPKKASTVDVDDYDDPLADLLGDDSKKPTGRRRGQEPTSPSKDTNRPRTAPGSGSDSSESRRLEIDRPPTRSGNKTPAKHEPSMFDDDDDDPLGALGFDESPRREAPAALKHQAAKEDGAKGRSIMDDLLGTGPSTPSKPTPSSSGGKREFVLDKKYLKQEELRRLYLLNQAKPKEATEEDFTFGGYMPSAANTPGSRPSSKRSVRFKGDDEEDPAPRGGSAPAGRSRNPASVLEQMMAEDNRDWLELAADTGAQAKRDEDKRPKSEGSVRKSDSSASEPMDWLGLSRIGSPSGSRPADDPEEDFMQPPSRPRSGGRSGVPKELPAGDDWLGTSSPASPKKTPQKKTEPKSDRASDDWLGTGMGASTEKDDDWLGLKESPAAKDSDNDDWLGLSHKSGKGSSKGKEVQSDDWLGQRREVLSPAEKDGKSDDWLGLSGKRESKSDGTVAGDYMSLGLEIDDPFKPSGSKARADERGLDLFSPPPGKDTSTSTLPWETDNATARRRGRSRTPQKVSKPASPKSASPRGPSPSDSPRDLMATLEALKKMEQKKPGGPVKAVTTTAPTETLSSEAPYPGPEQSITSSFDAPGTSAYGFSPDVMGSMATIQTSPMVSYSGLEELQKQEEMMRKQQEAMREQQQKQQMEMQRQMVEQQKQAREQMQKRMEQQQKMMKLQMEQQFAQMSQPSVMPTPMMPNMAMGGSMYGDELFSQVKRLEMEKLHLMNLMETTKSQHLDEVKLLEESQKKRLELVEESWSRREQRLKEENEFLISQHQSKVQMMEQEKSEQGQAYLRRQEMWEAERQAEIDRLREQHRNDLNTLRQQHEESLERVRRAKELEVEAVASQHSTSRSLHDVIERISENARGLNELQSQVHIKHNLSLDERENAARAREEQVKALQERLERQHHENEQERARLQGLLSKMEAQLTEQTRSMEEEKWRVRQEESRHLAAQEALEKERMVVMDQFKRERESIQRSKDQLLEEQKSVLAQLYEERRVLAQERAAFEMNNKISSEKMQRESLKNVKTGAELEGSVRILNDEKTRLAQQLDDLRAERDSLSRDRSDIDQQRQALVLEKEKLEKYALQLRQCSKDMEERCLVAEKAQGEGSAALMEARRLEGEQGQRLNSIQAQLNTLRTKERQIAQERLSLAKEKQNIEESAKSSLCVNCRTPVRDTAGAARQLQFTNVSNIQATQVGGRKMTAAASNLLSSLDPDLRAKVENMDSISAQIELDRSIRMWRIAASKDQDFLTEESMFLQAIRHTPYGESTPKS